MCVFVCLTGSTYKHTNTHIYVLLRVTFKSVYLRLYMLNLFRGQRTMAVLNKNCFCLMPVHTCVAECAWSVGYTRHWEAAGGRGWGGGVLFGECTSGGVYIRYIYSMPGESYCRSLLLYLCDVFRALINSLVCGLSSFRIQVKPACRKTTIHIDIFACATCRVSRINMSWTTACNTVRFSTQEHVFP